VSPDLVSSSVAAKLIGVSRQRVHQLVAEGRLHALKVETSGDRTQLVFRRTEIERFKGAGTAFLAVRQLVGGSELTLRSSQDSSAGAGLPVAESTAEGFMLGMDEPIRLVRDAAIEVSAVGAPHVRAPMHGWRASVCETCLRASPGLPATGPGHRPTIASRLGLPLPL
jgi:hypothetical protein